jgi:hypothetical protein
MKRFAEALAILLTASSFCLALDLPRPPDGFKWREVDSIQGAFLVPDGWHFRNESAKGTLAYFITEDEFVPPAKYQVGVSINVFLGNSDGPSQIEKLLRAQAEHYHVELVPGTFGPFRTLQCQYDLPKTPDHEPIRVVHLGIMNPDTNASYLVMFESPVQQWDRAWATGKVIVKTLALNGRV